MTGQTKMTAAQRKVLRILRRQGSATPRVCGVPYTTFAALERRGFIKVDTTFDSLVVPQHAVGHITPAGRAALEGPEGDRK